MFESQDVREIKADGSSSRTHSIYNKNNVGMSYIIIWPL